MEAWNGIDAVHVAYSDIAPDVGQVFGSITAYSGHRVYRTRLIFQATHLVDLFLHQQQIHSVALLHKKSRSSQS